MRLVASVSFRCVIMISIGTEAIAAGRAFNMRELHQQLSVVYDGCQLTL